MPTFYLAVYNYSWSYAGGVLSSLTSVTSAPSYCDVGKMTYEVVAYILV